MDSIPGRPRTLSQQEEKPQIQCLHPVTWLCVRPPYLDTCGQLGQP